MFNSSGFYTLSTWVYGHAFSDFCFHDLPSIFGGQSGTGGDLGPIPRPEESYRMCVCVCVCHWQWSGATIALHTYSEQVGISQNKKETMNFCLRWGTIMDIISYRKKLLQTQKFLHSAACINFVSAVYFRTNREYYSWKFNLFRRYNSI